MLATLLHGASRSLHSRSRPQSHPLAPAQQALHASTCSQEAQRRFRHFAAAHPEEVLDAMERDPNLLIMGLPMLGPGGFDDGFDDENDDEFVGGGDGEEDDEDDGSDNF